ncbi:MAG: peptide ABC transporter substrate-binding protein [Opitutaceae bacterium]|nr:peptide ABC transporter substrate-binding protein [Opitutaceae bacterium]
MSMLLRFSSSSVLSTFLLVAATLVCGGCSKRETQVEAGLRTQTLHMAISAEPRDLDPHILVAYNDMTVCLALFEGLVAVDETTSRPEPACAERWQESGDGRTWTFFLHKGMKWSDGHPLGADDFVHAFRRALSPRLGSEYAYVLFPIEGAEAYNSGKNPDASSIGVRAIDNDTLEIRLNAPTPTLLAILALPVSVPVPRHVIERLGAMDDRANRWTRPNHIVSNGPFRVTEWTPNKRIVTVRNPNFRDNASTQLSSVIFYPYESATAQETAFRAGQIHLTSEIPISKIASYKSGPEASSLRLDPFLETGFFRFNVDRGPLKDPRVRSALARALDRRTLVDRVALAGQQPAHSLTPPNTAGYTAAAGIPDDFEAARRLLAEAGFPGGKGFPILEIMSFTNELNQRLMEAIQQMWKRELGVNVTLALKEQRVWLDDERERNYAISCARWIGDYVDPGTFLDMFLSNSGNNATGWSNPDYDHLVRSAATETDGPRRYALFQEAEAILMREAPIAPLYHGTRPYLINPTVKGWEPALLGFHRYQRVSLQPRS